MLLDLLHNLLIILRNHPVQFRIFQLIARIHVEYVHSHDFSIRKFLFFRLQLIAWGLIQVVLNAELLRNLRNVDWRLHQFSFLEQALVHTLFLRHLRQFLYFGTHILHLNLEAFRSPDFLKLLFLESFVLFRPKMVDFSFVDVFHLRVGGTVPQFQFVQLVLIEGLRGLVLLSKLLLLDARDFLITEVFLD